MGIASKLWIVNGGWRTSGIGNRILYPFSIPHSHTLIHHSNERSKCIPNSPLNKIFVQVK